MRDHAIVSPQFWTGKTGRYIRSCGGDAQRVALYLLTCPNSNMIGLYYLPLPTLCHEIGIPLEGATKALQCLSEGDFCVYDDETETVFVREMARFQVGKSLSPNDKRVKGVAKMANQMAKSPFYKDFLDRYMECYHLENLVEEPENTRPSEAPSMPHRSQDQDQEQDQEQDNTPPINIPPPARKKVPAYQRDGTEKHLDHVYLKPKEVETLVRKYGQERTDRMIETLNNYFVANIKRLKKYSNHYGVINSWVAEKVLEKMPMEGKTDGYTSFLERHGEDPSALREG